VHVQGNKLTGISATSEEDSKVIQLVWSSFATLMKAKSNNAAHQEEAKMIEDVKKAFRDLNT
jgi:hypothetical protein